MFNQLIESTFAPLIKDQKNIIKVDADHYKDWIVDAHEGGREEALSKIMIVAREPGGFQRRPWRRHHNEVEE